jgi:hypothetical protein
MKRMLSGFGGILLCAVAPLAFPQPIAPLPFAPKLANAPLHFNDLNEVYGYIAQNRGLGKSGDESLVHGIAVSSSVQQVKDPSGDSLMVIRADLVTDGTSRLESAAGNYPYYVLRRDGDQLTLLGTMFGAGYATSRIHGHLQFTMHFREAAGQVRPMRFQVRGKALFNLTPLGGQTAPYIAGIHFGFEAGNENFR